MGKVLKYQDDISSQRALPVSRVDDSFSVTAVTGETVTFSYYNSGTLTTDAGQAAGTLVIGKLAYGPILDDMGAKVGNKGNTSLSFTCAALTTEKVIDWLALESSFEGTGTGMLQSICAGFANGDYAIDYRTGTIYAKKATTAATMTSVAYKRASASGGGGSSSGSTGASSVSAEFISPTDFTATYTSSSTITITGMPFTITNSSQIVYVKVYNTSTRLATTYVAGSGNISFGYSAGVITIYSSGTAITALTSNDTYEVGINGQEKAYDPTTDTEKSIEQSPLSAKYVQDSLLDTTNVAAATNYYPSSTGMSMDGFSSISFSGKFIDADNTTTMTIEAMDDEDTSGDWIDVTQCFNNDKAGIATGIGASVTVTSGTVTFAISRLMFNYSYFRVKLVTGDATNTCIIKCRRMY
jgi:hypothetical protein